jgi:16S rRNA (guanine527-N7)-methyltransferase
VSLPAALECGLAELGLSVNAAQRDIFLRFRELLMKAGPELTGFRSAADVDLKGIVDSLTCLRAIPLAKEQRLVDVGAGGGLPGIPLAVAVPGLQVTLLEASVRKGAFLQGLVATLGLPEVRVVVARAEEFGRSAGRASYDVATIRAVASLAVAAEYCLPLLKRGGALVAMKGPAVAAEMDGGIAAARLLGGGRPEAVELKLPVLGHRRILVVIRKLDETPPGYPRRVGVPSKRPLGEGVTAHLGDV